MEDAVVEIIGVPGIVVGFIDGDIAMLRLAFGALQFSRQLVRALALHRIDEAIFFLVGRHDGHETGHRLGCHAEGAHLGRGSQLRDRPRPYQGSADLSNSLVI